MTAAASLRLWVFAAAAFAASCDPPPAIDLDGGVEDAGPEPDGGSPDGGVDDTVAAADYCETTADVFCPYYLRCGRMAVDTEEACRAAFLTTCNAQFEPSYTALEAAGLLVLDRAGIDACAAHLDAVACEAQIFDLDGPCSSMWRGTQAVGGACGFDIESFVCAPGSTCTLGLDFCGSCEAVVDDGAACSGDGVACARGSSCEDGVCVRRAAVGESCAAGERCVLGASCQGGVCRGPAYVGVGAACGQGVRCAYGASCEAGVCAPTVGVGGACSDAVSCDASFCDDGVCVPLVAQGAPCSVGAQCQTGVCIEGACSVLPGLCF